MDYGIWWGRENQSQWVHLTYIPMGTPGHHNYRVAPTESPVHHLFEHTKWTARHLGARDRYIGWSAEARRRNLRSEGQNLRAARAEAAGAHHGTSSVDGDCRGIARSWQLNLRPGCPGITEWHWTGPSQRIPDARLCSFAERTRLLRVHGHLMVSA